MATPQLGQIVSGNVSIAEQANNLQITQNTQQAIVNWNSFNINSQENVHFQQPTNGICLNRIDAASGMSQIHGQLSATGRIILINEAGILFGESAKVNVGGIIASTIGMSDENFKNNKFIFDQPSSIAGSIINKGTITVADHGLAAFLGTSVANQGVIVANMSKVILATGNKFALDFYGDGVINFAVDEAVMAPGRDELGNNLPHGVDVSGQIISDAGEVLITGRAAQNVFDNLINISGIIRATSAIEKNGKIILLGDEVGMVKVTGELDASGITQNASGGSVHVLGAHIDVNEAANITTAGANGGGEILIGGDYKGRNPEIQNALTTVVGANVNLNADATTLGDGGKVIVWSNEKTEYYGKTYARGGAERGNGGFLEISSGKDLIYDGSLNLSAANGNKGNVLFDPRYLVVRTGGGAVAYSAGVNNLFTNNIGSTTNITPASIVSAATTSNITLQANTDVVFTNDLAITTAGSTLTVSAGRSVLFNANVSTNNAAITVTANDTNATSSDRNTTSTGNPAGDSETTLGNITQSVTHTLSSGTGPLSLTIGPSTTAPYSPGSISLVTIVGGAITLTSPKAVAVATSIAASTSLNVTIGTASTIAAVISGAGSFTYSGTSTLTLSNTNTYTGSNFINAGVLQISIDRNLGAIPGVATPGSITFGGGTLISTASFTLNANRGIATGTGAIIDPNSGTTLTYNGIIAGSGPLTMAGAGGILSLGGANTYTGATNVTAGTLTMGVANAIQFSSALVMSSSATATYNLNSLNQIVGSLSGGSSATVGNISLGTATLTVNQTVDGIYSGVISSGVGTTDLILSSSSTNKLTLANTNTFTGATVINGGILAISQDANLGAAPGVATAGQLSFGGGTLETTATFALSSNRGIALNAGGGTILADPGTTLTYNGIMAGGAGNTFTASGSSTSKIILGGVNTYSGATTITSGALSLTNASALGGSSSISIASGAGLDLNFSSATLGNTNTITLNDAGVAGAGGITLSGTSITVNNPITLASAATIGGTGSGSMVLGGTISGAVNLTVNLPNAAVSLPVITLTGSGALSVTAGGAITQTGVATVPGTSSFTAGANAITLTQSNQFTGAVSLSNSGANNVSVTNGKALVLAASTIGQNLTVIATGSITQTGAVTVSGTSSFTAGANPITLTQSNALTGAVTLSNSGANDVSITNGIALSLAASSVGRNLTTIVTGAITQTGALTVPGTSSFSAGANPITLTQTNTFTGAVSLSNSGANNVSVTNSTALGLGTSTIGQNLTLISGGSITQTGVLTATGGTTTVSSTVLNSDILLSQANNLGSIAPVFAGTLANIRDVNLNNTNASAAVPSFTGLTNLRNLTITFNNAPISFPAITLTSGGSLSALGLAISQTGILTVPGTSNLNADGHAITLTLSNAFTGAVTLTNNGANNVSITNSIGLVLAASTIGNNLTAIASGAITQTGALTVPGTSNFTASANPITLTQNNLFTGAVSLSNSGANDVSVTNSIPLALGISSIGQNLTLISGGSITQTGALAATGINTMSVTVSSSDILLSNAANNLGSIAPVFAGTLANIRDVSLANVNASAVLPSFVGLTNLRNLSISFTGSAVALPAITLTSGGNLSVTAGGAITQSGLLTIPGTSSFNAGSNPITLTQTNAFTGAVSLNNTGVTNDVSITNGIALVLDASSIGRNLTVIAAGAITQTGILSVHGTSSFSAGANPITLTQNNIFTGAMSLTNSGANDVSVTNSTAIVLDASTIGRNLTLISGGAITQTGALTATGGTLTLSATAANSDVLLSQANNLGTTAPVFAGTLANIRDVSLNNTNAGATLPSFTGLSSLRNLTITFGSAALAFPAITLTSGGNLAATAGGAITQTGALSVPGTSNFSAGANPITLTQGNAFTGAVTLSNSGANDVSITNGIALSLGASTVGRNLTVIASGAISQTGALTVPGTSSFSVGANAITLTATNSFTGAVTVSNSGANDVSVTNSIPLVLAASTIGRNLTLISGGSITQTGVLTAIGGTTTLSSTAANSDILLSQTNNLGSIAPVFAGTLANIRDVNINNTNASASVPSFASLSNLRNLTLTYSNAPISLQAIALTNGGNLSITAGGAITQTGVLTVPGTSSFSAGANSITLTQSNAFTGAVSLTNSNSASVTNGSALVLGTSNVASLTVIANGPITQTGILTVSGISSFSAGANPITLTLNNAFSGDVLLSNSGANNVSVTNSIPLVLGTSTIGQNLTLISGGSITQTGVLTATGGATTLSSTTASSDILLSQVNDLGGIAPVFAGTLTNIRDVSLHNTNVSAALPSFVGLTNLRNLTITFNNAAISFPAITLNSGGNLTATAGGAITQSGALIIPGTSNIDADGHAINLTQALNAFTGAVSLTNTGSNNVNLTNSIGLVLGTSTVGNNLTVIAAGAISQIGVLTVPGLSSFSASANPITLTQNNILTGAVTLSNSGANDVSVTNNTALILAGSTIGRNLTIIANGGISQTGVLTVPGTSSFSAGANPIALTQTNAFTGAVSLNNSGTNDVSITNGAALILGAASIGRNLAVIANGAITQTGALTVLGTSSFSAGANPITLTQNNAFTGAVSLANSGANDVSVTNTLPLVIGTSTIGRNLTLIAGGSITQTGIITAAGGTTTVSSTAANSDILLPLANDLGTAAPVITGTLSNIRNVNINNVNPGATPPVFTGLTNLHDLTISFGNAAIDLPTITLTNGGSLTVTGGGAITQSGILTIPGTSSFTSGANPITLTLNNAFTGAVSFSNSGTNDVSVTNSIALVLGASTIGRNLTVIASGAISQTGALNVPGTASFTAGANAITLTQSNAFTGAVALSNSGANNISVTNTLPYIFGTTTIGQNLTLISGGSITQTGIITAPNGVRIYSLTVPNSDIILPLANNLGTLPPIPSGTASNIRDIDFRNINAGATLPSFTTGLTNLRNVTVVYDNAAMVIPAATLINGGNLSMTAGGAITQSGPLIVPGTSSFITTNGAITLTQNNAFTGVVTLNNNVANDVSITNSIALALGTSNIGRNLVVSANGAITQTGILTVPGTSRFSSNSNPITLTLNNVFTGAVSLTNGSSNGINDVSITNSIALAFGLSTIGNNLTAIANGAITQIGALTVGGTSSFTAGANPITLTSSNTFNGAVSLSNSGANNVSITDTTALELATSTIGNNFIAISGGAITQTGVLTVGGTSSFSASSNPITLTQTNAFTGAVSVENTGPNDVNINNGAALVLATSTVGRNLTVTASGAITQTGILTVGGTSSFSAGANPITLTQNNMLSGAISLSNSGSNDISLTNALPTALAEFTVGRNLTVATTGTITQTGVLTVPGTSSFSAGSNPILLTQNNLFSGAVSLTNTGANNVQIINAIDLILGASTIGRNLFVSANGAITQSGALTVQAEAFFVTGAHPITLTQNNSFIGDVHLNNSGANNVSITNSIGLIMDTSSVGNNLNFVVGGSITQVGTITAPNGVITVSLTVPNSDVILPLANDFGSLPPVPVGTLSNFRDLDFRNINPGATLPSFTGGLTNLRNVTVVYDNAPIIIPATTLINGGNISLTAGGAITQAGALIVPGTSTFNAGTNPITLTQNNALTGAVVFSNSGANDISITNTIGLLLGASSIGRNLTVVATGPISQNAGLTIPGDSSFTAGANPITLTQNNNFIGAVSVNNSGANDVSIIDSSSFQLGTSTVGRNLTLTSGGSITQTGPLTATGGTTTLSLTGATSDILLSQANDLGSIAPVFAGTLSDIRDVNLRNTNAAAAMPSFTGVTNLRNLTITFNNSAVTLPTLSLTSGGRIIVTAGGAITQTGTLSVQSTASFSAGANPITLTQNNVLLGAVTLSNTGANDVSLTNNRATILASSSIGRNLTVTSAGALSQTGAISVAGISTFNAGANAITLTQNNAFAGAVRLNNSGAHNVSVNNGIGLVLGTSSVGNNLTATASGAITQTGILTIPGTSSFVAGANPITLTQNNVLSGAVSLSNSGSNAVSLTTAGALVLGTTTVGQNLNLTAGGNITQTAAITANSGTTTIASTAAGSSVTLNAANDFGATWPAFGGITNNIINLSLQNTTSSASSFNMAALTNVQNLALLFPNTVVTVTSLSATTNANLQGNDVIGSLNVQALQLGTTFSNTTGFVNGQSGILGANQIQLLIPIKEGTNFFDGIDLVNIPPAPPTPTPTPTPAPVTTLATNSPLVQAVYNSLYIDYAELMGMYSDDLLAMYGYSDAAADYFSDFNSMNAHYIQTDPFAGCKMVGGIIELCDTG